MKDQTTALLEAVIAIQQAEPQDERLARGIRLIVEAMNGEEPSWKRVGSSVAVANAMMALIAGDCLRLKTGTTLTVFGSARIQEGSSEFERFARVCHWACQRGVRMLVNGCGPGVMGAGAEGGRRAKADGLPVQVIGWPIKLPSENDSAPWALYDALIPCETQLGFRKAGMIASADIVLVPPWEGLGTLDEISDLLLQCQLHKGIETQIQNGKIPDPTVGQNIQFLPGRRPTLSPLPEIFLCGDIPAALDREVFGRMEDQGFISPGDRDLFTIVPNMDDVEKYLGPAIDRCVARHQKDRPAISQIA